MDVLVSGYVGTYDKMLELSGNHTSFQTFVYENRLLVNPRSAKTGVLVRTLSLPSLSLASRDWSGDLCLSAH